MRHVGVIVAAGKGSRFGGDIPKQFTEVGGHPLLFYSLKVMQESFLDEIVVVTGEDWIDYVQKELAEKFSFSKVTAVVKGGKERFDSVVAGLRAIKDPTEVYAYIHDGARPLLSQEILNRVKDGLETGDAVVVGVPSKDTVKIVDEGDRVINTPQRSRVWLAQTPQAFKASELLDAYIEAALSEALGGGNLSAFTDDASVMERCGQRRVKMVMGDYSNIKVTTPEDIEFVSTVLTRLGN